MRVMGIEANYQKPNTRYIPMARWFVYLVAVMDWFSRRVLARRLSIGMDNDSCVVALEEAMERFGQMEVFNTD